MRIRRGWYAVLAVVGVAGGWCGIAVADVTTEKSASILVWPKVVADVLRDTVIQLTNTSNAMVRAHCFYVNGTPTDPTRPPGPLNPPLWQEVDFTLQLTKQQPTQWVVSNGRRVDPSDQPCAEFSNCREAGFDPGRVPPVVPLFAGELKCVEVDDSGAPVAGNHLLGLATIFTPGLVSAGEAPPPMDGGDEALRIRGYSKYNAIGLRGDENNGDDLLVIGGGQCAGSGAICQSDDDCGDQGPCAPEYGACPQTWILDHLADGAPNLAQLYADTELMSQPSTRTDLTIVPCTQNFETQVPTTVTLQFLTFNEFESPFSVSTSVTCWGNFNLADVGAPALTFAGQTFPDPQGTMYLQTRIRSAAGTPFGVMMVAEEFNAGRLSEGDPLATRVVSTDGLNLHVEGERQTPDLITIPADQLEP